MAMTATISLSPSTVQINQQINATITVSNSGGSAVNVTSIQMQSKFTGGSQENVGCAFGSPNLGPAAATSVAASGSTVFPVPLVFFAPSTGPIGTGSGTFDVGCIIQSSDGSVFSPTAATVTVNPISYLPNEL